MLQISKLLDRVITRVNINLREPLFDVGPWVEELVPLEDFFDNHSFYGISHLHPVDFYFSRSALAGSYFLGNCSVERSLLYYTDVRGDELKSAGDAFSYQGLFLMLDEDERIKIQDSLLVKTLVHNNSHDPESPERFLIANTVSLPYANIHGSPVDGCFLGPFSTLDLTSAHHSVIGTFSYVQTGDLAHHRVDPGIVWIRSSQFEFLYRFGEGVLDPYIRMNEWQSPQGLFMETMEGIRPDFEEVYKTVKGAPPVRVPAGTALSRYAVVKGDTELGYNVLVAQRAYLDNAIMGDGANAQENCCIINSTLAGCNVTAHGATIMGAEMGHGAFTGFNAFLHGRISCPLTVGENCIIMPHTIIDISEPLEIPPETLVWGLVRNEEDLARHSIHIETLMNTEGDLIKGNLRFTGSGPEFVKHFQERISHILEENGAYSNGMEKSGHAQKGRHITYNVVQPYPAGDLQGLCPTIRITP